MRISRRKFRALLAHMPPDASCATPFECPLVHVLKLPMSPDALIEEPFLAKWAQRFITEIDCCVPATEPDGYPHWENVTAAMALEVLDAC